jgi:hypothetical protein
MLGKSKGGDRGVIDAARGSRKAAGFLQLHQKFTDPEVVVPLSLMSGSAMRPVPKLIG